MSAIRDRAKEHFPMVLLTLLSIVQALALELLWTHISEADYLLTQTWIALVAWIQIASTFIGLILIWVVYAANTMRFRWVPVTSDSVYPFIIGIFEFMLVETLDPGESGQWLVLMAIIFAVMVRVSHRSMQRARMDVDNDSFFKDYDRATPRDFMPQILIVSVMALAGAYVWISKGSGTFTFLALLATFAILVWQFYQTSVFWRRTVVDKTDEQETNV